MSNNSLERFIESQERLRRQLEPFSAAVRALEADSGVQRLVKDLERNRELMRAAFGPFEELRQSGAFDVAAKLGGEFRQVRDMIAEHQRHLSLPEVGEAAKVLREFENSGAAKAMAQFRQQQSGIQRAMEAMRVPWLDMDNRIASITGFVELQDIGHALRTMPAFDTALADRLRVDLGDWRGKINWPDSIFTDPLARTHFYTARGLDPGLTAFPSDAFEQSISVAGIKRTPPPLIAPYGYEPEAEEDEEESGLIRTNAAHDRLQRFESQMRKFIDEQMTAAFGDNWIKHKVDGTTRKEWLEKKQKAQDAGEPERPLIAYADFTDYETIIVRNDNWEAVFRQVFRRKLLVQESLQRLYPVRICTMHSRIITQDDELYLHAETTRLLTAIGVAI